LVLTVVARGVMPMALCSAGRGAGRQTTTPGGASGSLDRRAPMCGNDGTSMRRQEGSEPWPTS
jgi:hypothetical protein